MSNNITVQRSFLFDGLIASDVTITSGELTTVREIIMCQAIPIVCPIHMDDLYTSQLIERVKAGVYVKDISNFHPKFVLSTAFSHQISMFRSKLVEMHYEFQKINTYPKILEVIDNSIMDKPLKG